MNKKISKSVISTLLMASMLTYTMPAFANTKEETVYTKLNNIGKQYSTTVSTKISNDDNSEFLSDISKLVEITNTNGGETFEKNGNELTWKANGKSIQYQGKTEEELPISVSIKYELNGVEVEPKDIVGKSGKVKVTLTYTNNESHSVKVNGRYVKMYTPFVVMAGTIVNEETAKNVTITNGKILNNGANTIAIGMCMPGLQESLGISKSDYEIPNSISIEMDTENFEMNNIMSYATCKVLTEKDINIFSKLDKIYDSANQLKDASTQLVEGSTKLSEGAKKLNAGVKNLSDGAKAITVGGEQLSAGTQTLNSGIDTVTSGIQLLKSKLPQNTSAEENEVKLNTLSQGNKTAIQTLTQANEKVSEKITALKAQKTQLTSKISQIETGIKTKTGVTTLDNTTLKALEENEDLKYLVQLYELMLTNVKTLDTTITELNTQIEGNKQLITLLSGNETAVESSLGTIETMSLFNTSANELVGGLEKIQEGATAVAENSKKLSMGTSTLVAGINSLSNGTNEIATGANTLKQGIAKFDEEGITKLYNYINGDLRDIEGRAKALKKLAEDYNTFAGIKDGDEGTVQFITIIDSLKKRKF